MAKFVRSFLGNAAKGIEIVTKLLVLSREGGLGFMV